MSKSTALLALTMGALLAGPACAQEFGCKGGPEPANIDQVVDQLRADPYDLELLISFGNSKGGSAGHLALAIRDQAPGDDLVYSANFYADRAPEHDHGFYKENLMAMIPKKEYLYKTTSSLGDDASFGLDFGEVYKRSLIGIRVFGVPAAEKQALTVFFKRMNDDFHARATDVDYHSGEVVYDYMNLNCAKTIGCAFKYGAGYDSLHVKTKGLLGALGAKALKANLPTEMAMKLMEQWAERGYGMDVVLYKKSDGSPYVDPHGDPPAPFKDLPNRFPSCLTTDYKSEQGHYEAFENLYAMYLLYNMGKCSVIVNPSTKLLEIEKSKEPMAYAAAVAAAKKSAKTDSKFVLRRVLFRAWGVKVGDEVDNTHLYDFTDEQPKDAPQAPAAGKVVKPGP